MRGQRDGQGWRWSLPAGSAAELGRITVVCGCMFSGKTTELLRRLTGSRRVSALVFKHVMDRRYRASAVVSHDGRAWPAIPVESPRQMLAKLTDDVGILAVDEAHFFSPSVADVVQIAASRGIEAIVTSLDRDSWGRPFPVARQLSSIADTPILRHAVCARCGGVADRTQRLTPILGENMVGGPESYEPRCQTCWRPPPEPAPPYPQTGFREAPFETPGAASTGPQMILPASNTGPSVQQSW